jgi:hypothetical protein
MILSCSFQYYFVVLYSWQFNLIYAGVLFCPCLFGVLNASCINIFISFSIFNKFYAIILLNKLSIPLACTSTPLSGFRVLIVTHRSYKFWSVFLSYYCYLNVIIYQPCLQAHSFFLYLV